MYRDCRVSDTRALLTTHQFLPDYFSGTEILTYSTAKELQKRGWEVKILTGNPSKDRPHLIGRLERYTYEDIPVVRLNTSGIPSSHNRNPMLAEYDNERFLSIFRETVKEYCPSVVHFYHLQRLSVRAIDDCARFGLPSVFTATDFWSICPTNQLFLPNQSLCSGPDDSMLNCSIHMASISSGRLTAHALGYLPRKILNSLLKLAVRNPFSRLPYFAYVRALVKRPAAIRSSMRKVDRVLVATRFMGECLKSIGISPAVIRRVPFGIEPNVVEGIREKGVERSVRFGFIGTLYPHKGAHILLEAISQVPADVCMAVRIYGSTTQFPVYHDSLRSKIPDGRDVRFAGTFPNERIGEIFSGLDVLIVPSLWYENTPLVIYSAQAAKVPVVASDIGGLREVIEDGKNGLLFERGNSRQLAGIIDGLCKDRALIRSLSEGSVQPRTASDYVDELEAVYGEVAQMKGLKIDCRDRGERSPL